jgi:hypothetical protein
VDNDLTTLVFSILCLPHSIANVERVFSQLYLNKNHTRNRLKATTLEGLFFTKSLVSESGNCHNFRIESELTRKMNSQIMYTKNIEVQPSESDSSD